MPISTPARYSILIILIISTPNYYISISISVSIPLGLQKSNLAKEKKNREKQRVYVKGTSLMRAFCHKKEEKKNLGSLCREVSKSAGRRKHLPHHCDYHFLSKTVMDKNQLTLD